MKRTTFSVARDTCIAMLAIQLEESEAQQLRIVSEAKNGFGIQVDPG
jgi:hypothetical protein